ncbi:MAG: T9SS type A sorting domain-containing protein [Chitinophagales bacterium]|nr:T9SS type A sorting domain-containing protein [Chitinophagales bacterium]
MRKNYLVVLFALMGAMGAQAQTAFYNAGAVTVEPTGLIYVNGKVQIASTGSMTNDGTLEIKGDYQNDRTDGTISNGSSGERLVKFTATAGTPQMLTNSSGNLVFQNLESTNGYTVIANNPFGVEATADVRVNGTLNLNGGDLIMKNRNLTIGSSGTVTNFNQNNHVYFTTGEFRKKIVSGQPSTLHSFPYYRGDFTQLTNIPSAERYLPVAIRLNTAPVQADELRVKFIPQSSLGSIFHVGQCNLPGYPGNNITLNQMVQNFGYWQIDAVNASGTNIDNFNGWLYDITLSPSPTVVNALAAGQPAGSDYYKIIRQPSHDASGAPIALSSDWTSSVLNSGTYCDGIAIISSYVANYPAGITATSLNKFSAFGGAGNYGGAGLPVELVSVNAVPVDNKYIDVRWVTATETNNAGFEVEKSFDGVSFENIGWVEGAGNSTLQLNYNYADHDVMSNKNYYYRLKQLDFNGEFEYSSIVTARLSSESTFAVSEFIPNPTSNVTRIDITSDDVKPVSITLYNTLGQAVQSVTKDTEIGSNQFSFDIKDLADGTYFAIIKVGEETFNKKLVVTK